MRLYFFFFFYQSSLFEIIFIFTCLRMWLRLLFKMLSMSKYIKIIYIFLFFKIFILNVIYCIIEEDITDKNLNF